MKNESTEELVALFALGLADQDEMREAEALFASDPEAESLRHELEDTVGELALGLDPVEPPKALRSRIMAQLPDRGDWVSDSENPSNLVAFPSRKMVSWIPWSLAACFAVVCGLVIQNNLSLRKNLASVGSSDGIGSVEVATLGSMMATAPRAQAIAVWDGANQEGVLTISSLPALEPDKDYQLWIIDPQYENPVDGGVFSVSARGETRYQFKPNQPISTISAFAVSLERKGGVPKAEGPMVLISI